MTKLRVLKEDQSYTFRSFFDMTAEPEDILADLGYTLNTQRLTLPTIVDPIPWETEIKNRLEQFLTVVSLSNETARRETLVAPVLLEFAIHYHLRLRIEYSLNVSNWLKGNLDYLLRSQQLKSATEKSQQHFLIVEAKNGDLTRGFIQLAAEMIALVQDQALEDLYGAVTIGEVWRFGYLHTQTQHITQDLTLYTIPDHLSELLKVLAGILT